MRQMTVRLKLLTSKSHFIGILSKKPKNHTKWKKKENSLNDSEATLAYSNFTLFPFGKRTKFCRICEKQENSSNYCDA